eukprot:gnl/TRDRNA2_/TRDRNA2_147294_c2_seq1.p2 gnl/TRDRNA2_/TRDRNA2_147294_c2~~gnl/TRDRNA2_/TRDRNA2_147294_c2_seq1.p2  ORF type:complete len:112 (+),score=8.37 gnl/TRDRNA2_/TRDRNA2_147294_c2_seq1:104-439(+)
MGIFERQAVGSQAVRSIGSADISVGERFQDTRACEHCMGILSDEVARRNANPRLFAKIAIGAARRLRESTAQELAVTAWALAAASRSQEELFVEARHRVSEFKAVHLADTA